MSVDNKFVRSLIQNAKQGNNAAIEQLFQMNLGKIHAFLLRLTANKSLAESVTKETFIEAWKKIGLVRPDASFLKWLNAIAVYKTIDGLRSRKSDPKKNKEDIKELGLNDELDTYILSLPEQERMIFVLNKLEGYTVEEISDLMGSKKDQIEAQLKSANDKIISSNHQLSSPEVMKEKIARLIPELEPSPAVRDGIFSYIMEEKIKEQKEIEKIAAQVEEEEKEIADEEFEENKDFITKEEPPAQKKKKSFDTRKTIIAAVGLAVVIAAIFIIKGIFAEKGWEILQFSGSPQIDGKNLTRSDTFDPLATLTTNDKSSVTLSIPEVGRLLIDSSSVVKRQEKGVAIDLEQGQLRKFEDNASDFITVKIPLATIQELYKGSAFRLKILDTRGSTKINVESGWIVVEVKEFKSYVPKNFDCLVSKGRYALPYSSDSSPELKSLFESFSGVNDPSIGTILSMATRKDAITLWHLLQLVSNENRFIVFDKLNELVPVPNSVTKEGIQALNKNMLMDWRQEIELRME